MLVAGYSSWVFAVYDPLSVPNNKFGVHILERGEITAGAKLVNSNGGDWGYITIPLRIDDRDREKWTEFFLQAGKLHVIPIIRLATYSDPAVGGWVTPTAYDLVDFANFLSDMPWPTQNRYIILFNEPNHASEWGGKIDPLTYATLVLDSREIFGSRSANYFLLSAGLDMSVPTSPTSLDALEYYRRLSAYQPKWYLAIDGLAVHAYPNPGFTASPYSTSRYGIASYRFETKYLSKLGYAPKPLFITETGSLSPDNFFPIAFRDVWIDPQIVAVTPFVLFAGTGPFEPFSLLDASHSPRPAYRQIESIAKSSGSPLLSSGFQSSSPPSFSTPSSSNQAAPISGFLRRLKRLLFSPGPQFTVGNSTVELIGVADTSTKRSQGLSGRAELGPNEGLLFTFDSPFIYTFWMKGMRFSLDFVWILKGRVVDLIENVPPPSSQYPLPRIVAPASPVDQVLEVPAGFIKKYGIKVGDQAVLTR